MSELKVTTLKHADSTVDSIVMASDGTLSIGGAATFDAAITDSAGVAIQGGVPAQAWVNFNGTGTVAIRAGYNVSSITDNGTGNYTVNFTTAMADANYAVCLGAGGGTATNPSSLIAGTLTTSSFPARAFQGSNSAFDQSLCLVSVFR
tara:strand:- start:310 stop:753 length:444 start_codon:yes stop_codon:yes gene_type:complete